MNAFPQILSVVNKNNFIHLNNERILCLFREHVYLHMLKNFHSDKDENNYIDLDVFCKQHLNNKNERIIKDIVVIVAKELEALGWKCALSFNDTGLFIYSTPNKPASCW
uniref:Uncharacterized protein n=1 Tax=viral metagenome TaxID=1070528 RepID=A0A6C0E1H8_9ZZZZ